MREVYLDNASTTRVRDEVIEEMNRVLRHSYGNPSSLHRMGLLAEKEIKDASKVLANILDCDSKDIIYCSGGSEANSLALSKVIAKSSGNIITGYGEHPSVYDTLDRAKAIEKRYIRAKGKDAVDEALRYLDEETLMICLMHVNNETGEIYPVEELAKLARAKGFRGHFHVDGVQGFGKVDFAFRGSLIDSYSISGHKIHGPKGIGALVISKEQLLSPQILGGGQQRGLRGGTENVAGIVGLAKAASLQVQLLKNSSSIKILKEKLTDGLSGIEGVVINSNSEGSPYIVNASFKNAKSEVLLHCFESKGVYVSAGSACSSNSVRVSRNIESLKLDKEYKEGTLRFSLGSFVTMDDLDYAIDVIRSEYISISKYFG